MKGARKYVSSGFTLIELVIVIAIISLISGLGMVSLRDHSDKQILSETANDFASALQLARSRAQTQVKPQTSQSCSTKTLDGYQVEVKPTESGRMVYEVRPICGGNPDAPIRRKTFPSDITVQSEISPIVFQTLTGAVEMPGSDIDVSFSGDKGQAVIVIYANGRIVRTK